MTSLNGIQSAIGTAQSVSGTVTRGVGSAMNLARHLGLKLPSDEAGQWFKQLKPAAWRGVPFYVLAQEVKFGRRPAVHLYPYRDTVWIEDMGRMARRVSLAAYLVGDDVIDQLNTLMAAAEKAGKGELVHPLLGRMTVSLIHGHERSTWEQGRVVELLLEFLEAGERLYPTTVSDTGSAVKSAASAAKAAAAKDWLSKIASALKKGAATLRMVMGTVAMWARRVQSLINDVTNLADLPGELMGEFGRYFTSHKSRSATTSAATATLPARASSTKASSSSPYITPEALTSLSAATVSRATISADIANLVALSKSLTASKANDFAAAAQTVVEDIAASATDPANGVRALQSIADFSVAPPVTSSPLADVRTTAQQATASLFRRLTVMTVAELCADYQPSSYDDAIALINTVGDLLDTEILAAADQGDDATYTALKALRVAVVDDLTTRGASLARVTTVTTPAPVPSLALAQRLYQDSARADELVAAADAIHPAFMPTVFKALAQ